MHLRRSNVSAWNQCLTINLFLYKSPKNFLLHPVSPSLPSVSTDKGWIFKGSVCIVVTFMSFLCLVSIIFLENKWEHYSSCNMNFMRVASKVCTCFHGHIKCWGNILSFYMCDVSFHLSDISFYMSDISFYMSDNVIGDMEKLKKNQCHFLWSRHLVFHISHAPSILLEPKISQSVTKRKSTFHALALMKWSQWLMDYTKPRIFQSTYRIGFWSR